MMRDGAGAWVALLGCAVGCAAASPPPAEPGPSECSLRLPAPGPAPGTPGTPGTPALAVAGVPLSKVIVNFEQELLPLTRLLEARVPKRVAEGRVGIGVGGSVSYTAERGALSLSISTGGALVIETPVTARAEACRGARCYASCAPEASLRVEVSLLLLPDYRFKPAVVSLRFTRGCQVRALGGLLKLDVTPTLQAELAPKLAQVGREIDRQLPNVRAHAEAAWRELSASREVPLLGCFVLAPQGIVQGPVEGSTRTLRARLAILATPELRAQCGEPPPSTPLPPLSSEPALPAEAVVLLGMVTPLAAVERAFSSTPPAEVAEHRFRTAQAHATARGSELDLDLTLAGDICGDVTLRARPDFSGDGQFIGLASAQVAPSERRRLAGQNLPADALARAATQAVRLAPLLVPGALRAAAPALSTALSRKELSIFANVSAARAAGAHVRQDELVAWLEARFSLTLKH